MSTTTTATATPVVAPTVKQTADDIRRANELIAKKRRELNDAFGVNKTMKYIAPKHPTCTKTGCNHMGHL